MAGTRTKRISGVKLARICAQYALDKKADDLVILDVRKLSPLTDYLIVSTATSSPHLRALRDEVVEKLREDHGIAPVVSDGGLESQWLVLGFSDVIMHFFTAEKREFYALEDLWNDAKPVEIAEA